MKRSSPLKPRSINLRVVTFGGCLLVLAATWSIAARDRGGSILNFGAVLLGFAAVESRLVSIRIGRESITHRFMEIPLCFGLALLAPWQLLLARLLGSGALTVRRQWRTPERAAFNIGYSAIETVAIAVLSSSDHSAGGRARVLIVFLIVEIFGQTLFLFAFRLGGLSVNLRDFVFGGVASLGISFVSALTGLVLVAAWSAWTLAVAAILPFAALFLKSWRGEIERSRKADALAALAELTTGLTASLPSVEAVSAFAGRLADLVNAGCVVVRLETVEYKWSNGDFAALPVEGHAPRSSSAAASADEGRGFLCEASFVVGDDRIGMLTLSEPVVGTKFTAETASVAETVADRLGAWFSNAALIDDLRREVHEREYLAFHDPLTDLANRRRFRDAFDEVLSASTLNGALVLLALDHFSMINDSVGHQQGDAALSEIANRLRSAAPPGALVARLGGDEFAVLISSFDDRPLTNRQRLEIAGDQIRPEQFQSSAIAKRLLDAVNDPPLLLAGMSFSLTASAGIATFPFDETDPSELLRQADQALQSAKSERNAFVFYSDERHRKDHEQVTLLGELRRALDEEEIILHYQPKIDLPGGGKLTGVEALVRWMHPTRGLVFPDDFVPIAEHYDLLNDMFFYIVEKAVHQLRNWSSDGLGELSVAVNLSARNLRAPNLTRRVSRIVQSYGLDPKRLTLELTETAIMTDSDHALRTLRSLCDECGVQIAVDDFGVGLSSIAYLRDLPASEVKIDKTFCVGLPGDGANEAIVRSINQLAVNLGKFVTVEGVEHEETYKFLHEIGIDQAQGYWIARPMEAGALKSWAAANLDRLQVKPRAIVPSRSTADLRPSMRRVK